VNKKFIHGESILMGEGMKSAKHVSLLLACLLSLPFLEMTTGVAPGFGQGHEHKGNHLGETTMTEKDKLTEDEGKYLLSVARNTIEQRIFNTKDKGQTDAGISDKFLERRGTFVTLTKGKNLRGCIGHIIPQESLIEGIRENAINAAFRDPRFPPMTKEEWDRINIEISILTDPRPLSYTDTDDLLKKLRPSIDGVIIRKGYYQSTFLPQVWEQLPKKEEFLAHLCLKAGLGADEWKAGDLEVLTYQVQAFEEEGHP
jgi:AmmeMemoRadiSam system protein A